MAAEVPDPPGPPNLPPTGGQNDFTRNVHTLLPNEVTIKAGGSVNFIIAGFHQVLIYENVSGPSDINSANLIPPSPPFFPPLVNDPENRIYRGLDPRLPHTARSSGGSQLFETGSLPRNMWCLTTFRRNVWLGKSPSVDSPHVVPPSGGSFPGTLYRLLGGIVAARVWTVTIPPIRRYNVPYSFLLPKPFFL